MKSAPKEDVEETSKGDIRVRPPLSSITCLMTTTPSRQGGAKGLWGTGVPKGREYLSRFYRR